jgi:hypothetical protein
MIQRGEKKPYLFAMEKFKKLFKRESKQKKTILMSAAFALIGTFFPWTSTELRSIFATIGRYAGNGWQGVGYLCVISSILILAMWILPIIGVKYKLPIEEIKIQKVLVLIMLAGPVLWIINMNFNFEFLGFGVYISLVAGAIAAYAVFKKSDEVIKHQ